MKCKNNKFLEFSGKKKFNRVLLLKPPIANLLKSQISGRRNFSKCQKC